MQSALSLAAPLHHSAPALREPYAERGCGLRVGFQPQAIGKSLEALDALQRRAGVHYGLQHLLRLYPRCFSQKPLKPVHTP